MSNVRGINWYWYGHQISFSNIKHAPLDISFLTSETSPLDITFLTFDISPRLSRAAVAKFEDIKEQSASGLKHAIEQHKYTDIRVDLKPSYVIIPHGGYYKKYEIKMLTDSAYCLSTFFFKMTQYRR